MDDLDPQRASEVLHAILREAGQAALARRRSTGVEIKDDGSPVTGADKAVDAFLAEQLPRAFPGCGVRGEEGAGRPGTRGLFHVDPIDGTQSFVDGLPYWGPTVCLVQDGALVFGAFYVPTLDEYWFAARDFGAFRDGQRLTMGESRWNARKQVLLVPSGFHRYGVPWPGKIRALGSTASHLALVAAGAGVATVVPSWALWDVGCGVLLVREAGGQVTGLDGSPIDLVNGAQGLPFMAGAPTALQNLATALAGRTDGEG